jgi:beta-lysine 5,6-aminomutase alpha subunit
MTVTSKLDLDPGVIAACHAAASQIAAGVSEEIAGKTTVSVERTVARLLGIDGANELEVPLPNVLVDHVRDQNELGRGIAYWLGNAMLADGSRSVQQVAEAVDAGELPCRPCDQRVCAPGDFRCLTAIRPDQVYAAALEALHG